MAQLIGIIKEISGVFYAKDSNGETRVLKAGDQLFVGETVIGDSGNGAQSFITFTMSEGGREYTVAANDQLLLDNTLLPQGLASDNVVQPEDLEEALMLDATYDNAQGQAAAAAAGDEVANAEDIENLEETAAAGTTEVDALEGRFADRTGDEVDITTDLRDATFPAGTEPVADVPADEPVDAVLSLSATPQLTEDGGIIIYTVTSDIAPTQAMIVTLSNGLTVTIGAGATSGTVSYPVAESDYEDVFIDSDIIPVSITGTTNGGFASVDYTTNGSASTEIVDTVDTVTATLTSALTAGSTEDAGSIVYTITLTNADGLPYTPTAAAGETFSFTLNDGTDVSVTVGQGQPTGSTTLSWDANSSDLNSLADADVFSDTTTVSVDGAILATNNSGYEDLSPADGTSPIDVTDYPNTVTATLTSALTAGSTEDAGSIVYTITLTNADGLPYTPTAAAGETFSFTLNDGTDVSVTVGQGQPTGSTTLSWDANSSDLNSLADADVFSDTTTVSVDGAILATNNSGYEDLSPADGTSPIDVTDYPNTVTATLTSALTAGSTEDAGSIVYTITLTNADGLPYTPTAAAGETFSFTLNDGTDVSVTVGQGQPTGSTTLSWDANSSDLNSLADADVFSDTTTVSVDGAILATNNSGYEDLSPADGTSPIDVTDYPNTVTATLTSALTAGSTEDAGSIVYTITLTNADGLPYTPTAAAGETFSFTLNDGTDVSVTVGQGQPTGSTTLSWDANSSDLNSLADADVFSDTTTVSVDGAILATNNSGYEDLSPADGTSPIDVTDYPNTVTATLTSALTAGSTEDAGSIVYTITLTNADGLPYTPTAAAGETFSFTLNDGTDVSVTVGQGQPTGSTTLSWDANSSDLNSLADADVFSDTTTVSVDGAILATNNSGYEDLSPADGTSPIDVTDYPNTVTATLTSALTAGSTEDAGSIVYTITLTNADGLPYTPTAAAGETFSFTLNDGTDVSVTVGQGQPTGSTTLSWDANSSDLNSLADADVFSDTTTVSVDGAILATNNSGYEDLSPADGTSPIDVTDYPNTVTATLTTTTTEIPEDGGIVTYIVTLSGGPGAIDPDNNLVFTLDNGEEVTIYAGSTVGSVTRTYTDAEITDQPNIVNGIDSYTGGTEYENLVTTGTTLVDVNYEPTISDGEASQSDAELFTQLAATGSLGIDYNVDGEATTNPFTISYDGGLGNLINQTSINGITTLVASTWVLTIDEANGDYTFTQTSPYTHAVDADSDSGTVTVTITDSDGQQASADLMLSIGDDIPSITASNAIGIVGDGTYTGTMDVDSGADIPAVTSVILNTVTVAGAQVQDFTFDYDSATGTGDGSFVYGTKTYNFDFTLDSTTNSYAVTIESVISIDEDDTLVATQKPGAPTETFELSYTDVETGSTVEGVATANPGMTMDLYTYDAGTNTYVLNTAGAITTLGDNFNVSRQGFGLGGNNNFESFSGDMTAESFTFNMDDPLSSLTFNFGGSGFSGNDLIYITLLGTQAGQTQTILLSATNGDFLFDGTTFNEIVGGFDGTTASIDSYSIDVPTGWEAIDSVTVTAGFEGVSDTSVKIDIDFTIGIATTEEVIMDYTAQVVDNDGDMDSVGFIVVSDVDEDVVNGTITGTPGDDYVSGTAGDDVIDALDGDDIIDGMGGDDTIDGGLGNDTLIMNSGDTLDFSSLGSGKVSNIENLDFRGGSETTITNLTVESVFDMTDDNNVLHLLGDNTDTVQIDDAQWTSNGTTTVDGVTYNQYQGSFNDGTVDQTVILNVQDTIEEEIV